MSEETEVVRKINQLKQQVNTKTQQDNAFQEEARRLIESCSNLVERSRTGIRTLLEKASRVANLEATVRSLSQTHRDNNDSQAGDLASLRELEQSIGQLAGALRTQDITGPLGDLNTSLQDLSDRIGRSNNPSSSGGGRKKKGGYSYTRKSLSRSKSRSRSRSRTKSNKKRKTKSKKR